MLAARRRGDARQPWRGVVAPHLLPHLLAGVPRGRRAGPVALLAAGCGLAIVAVAGPAWRREPSPLADATPPLAVVVKVTPSMATADVQPTRLARAVEKVHDLLADRRGAKAALVS